MQMTEYLQILTEQIRCKKAHPMIEEEYKAHMEDQAEIYMEKGMEKEEAMEAAVAQMGDPVEAGVALDGIHRPKMCKSLIIMIGMLTLIGIISQAVIFKEVDNRFVQESYLFYTIAYNLLGFFVMFAVCYMDYSFFAKHALFIYFGWIVLTLVVAKFSVLRFIGEEFGISYYQRSIIVYQLLALFGPVYAAILFRYRKEGMKGLLKAVILLMPGFWVALQNGKLSAFVELYAVALILFTIAFLKGSFGKYPKVKLGIMWGLAVLVPVAMISSIVNGPADSYRKVRIQAYLNPDAYAGEEGFVINNIGKVLDGLNVFGGNMDVLEGKLLPNTYNDYILLSIFHYFGIIIGTLVCVILAFFFIKAFRISFLQKNQLARLMGTACVAELFMRALIYTLTNFGLCPFAQMNMPFLSFGLLGTLVNSVLTGLLLSVYRYENVLSEKQMSKGPRYRIRIEKAEV